MAGLELSASESVEDYAEGFSERTLVWGAMFGKAICRVSVRIIIRYV